jgi:hypothetical protein
MSYIEKLRQAVDMHVLYMLFFLSFFQPCHLSFDFLFFVSEEAGTSPDLSPDLLFCLQVGGWDQP